MNSSMPLDAEYLVKLCSDTITLIDRARTHENEVFFNKYREDYFQSLGYKIRKFFGIKPPSKTQLYNRMCEDQRSYFFEWPSESYWHARKAASEILNAATEALQCNRHAGSVELQIAIDEFNMIHRTFKKLQEQNHPAYFNILPLAA